MLDVLPAALSRLKRRQLNILCSMLQAAHSHFAACLEEGSELTNCNGQVKDWGEYKVGETELRNSILIF